MLIVLPSEFYFCKNIIESELLYFWGIPNGEKYNRPLSFFKKVLSKMYKIAQWFCGKMCCVLHIFYPLTAKISVVVVVDLKEQKKFLWRFFVVVFLGLFY